MRILFVAPSVMSLGIGRYGGVEKLLADFAVGLIARGHKLTIAAPSGSKIPDGASFFQTVWLPWEADRDDLAALQILDIADEFDVIHDFSHGHGLARLSPKVRRRAIHHIWGPIECRYPVASYNIVAVSEWQRRRFRELHGQGSTAMPMIADGQKFKPPTEPRGERFLFLGAIIPSKGVHLAIKYAREMGVGLDVVGGLVPSPTESAYLSLVRRLCDEEQVKLHFNVDEETKIGFLQRARSLIYPVQQDEAAWLTGLEAWSCGTPTIAFNRGSMSEVLPAGGLSCVVPGPSELMTKMKEIPASGEDLNFVERIQSRHSVAAVLESYEKLYELVEEGNVW